MTDTIELQSIKIKSKVKATDRYKKFLQISSLFLTVPITRVEIDVLDEFYNISGGKLTTEDRRRVRETLDMSAEQLNNYIRTLRKKRIIIDDEINPKLMIDIPESVVFSLQIDLSVTL